MFSSGKVSGSTPSVKTRTPVPGFDRQTEVSTPAAYLLKSVRGGLGAELVGVRVGVKRLEGCRPVAADARPVGQSVTVANGEGQQSTGASALGELSHGCLRVGQVHEQTVCADQIEGVSGDEPLEVIDAALECGEVAAAGECSSICLGEQFGGGIDADHLAYDVAQVSQARCPGGLDIGETAHVGDSGNWGRRTSPGTAG